MNVSRRFRPDRRKILGSEWLDWVGVRAPPGSGALAKVSRRARIVRSGHHDRRQLPANLIVASQDGVLQLAQITAASCDKRDIQLPVAVAEDIGSQLFRRAAPEGRPTGTREPRAGCPAWRSFEETRLRKSCRRQADSNFSLNRKRLTTAPRQLTMDLLGSSASLYITMMHGYPAMAAAWARTTTARGLGCRGQTI